MATSLSLDQLNALPFNLKYQKISYSQRQRRPSLCINAVSLSARELIQSGAVRSVSAKDAVSVINNEDYRLLDIRPAWERQKAFVSGSLHVPLFVKDDDNSLITWLKKWVHFGYIGLWTGQKFTTINPDFLQEVDKVVSDKEVKILVVCGEGLRSLMAVTRLYNEGGYKNLGWLAGGFNRSEDDHFPSVEGNEKLQYATIGGASYYFLRILILLQAVVHEALPVPNIPPVKHNVPGFIVKTCKKLTDPALCQKTLAPYADDVKDNPAEAAMVAVNVDFSRTQRMLDYLHNVSVQVNENTNSDPKVVEATKICLGKFTDASNQIEGAKKILQKRDTEYKDSLDSAMDDADMNIALALSYISECETAWDDVGDSPLKEEVTRRSSKLLAFTNNARALADAFSLTVKAPEEDNDHFVFAAINISAYGPQN